MAKRIDYGGKDKRKWDVKKIMRLRRRHLLPSTITYYDDPLFIARASKQYVYDEKGRKYFDAFAGVVTISVGHCHPVLVERLQKQAATFDHSSTVYLYPQIVSFAEKLVQRMRPANPELEVCFFTNSGCEATELAAIIAKNYTGRHEFVALRHSFHGRSLMAMSMTGQSLWRHSLPYVYGIKHAPANNSYRRPASMSPKEYALWCADEVEEIIKYSTMGKIAGYIGEPIMGFGGVIDPEPEYFPRVRKIVHQYGGVFIADEIQTGVGRTGNKFCGIEQWKVKPDIVTMAKGMGNGYPLGAVVTTREVASAMEGKIHFNTFGGNPIAMTVGEAVLDILRAEKLPENAHKVGTYIKGKLRKLQKKSRWIGDVRGKGLMLGVELVSDLKKKTPAPAQTLKVMELMRKEGVLIGKGGMAGNVLRIKPPLCMSKADADWTVDALEKSLKRL